jgi:putative polyhydroxyalkanoate system protein
MSDIELVKSHSLPITKAKALVQKAANGLIDEYDLSSEWKGNTLHFHRPGVDGQARVTDSEIRLSVNLSFLLKALKTSIVSRIEQDFNRLFVERASDVQARKPARETARAAK